MMKGVRFIKAQGTRHKVQGTRTRHKDQGTRKIQDPRNKQVPGFRIQKIRNQN
jgi:hypothetical protein